ncbi:hypothetical protein D3C73_1445390 [compost metagenome]
MRVQQDDKRHVRKLLGIINEHGFFTFIVELLQNDMCHRLRQSGIRSGIRGEPVVSEFDIFGQIRGH